MLLLQGLSIPQAPALCICPLRRGGDTPAPTSGLQDQFCSHDVRELAVQGRGSWGARPRPQLTAQGQ